MRNQCFPLSYRHQCAVIERSLAVTASLCCKFCVLCCFCLAFLFVCWLTGISVLFIGFAFLFFSFLLLVSLFLHWLFSLSTSLSLLLPSNLVCFCNLIGFSLYPGHFLFTLSDYCLVWELVSGFVRTCQIEASLSGVYVYNRVFGLLIC